VPTPIRTLNEPDNMPKYCPENERLKRAYAFYLQAASGKQDATVDAALRAIVRFEDSTGRKPFSKFTVEQARSFRSRLVPATRNLPAVPLPQGPPVRRTQAARSRLASKRRPACEWLSR
jgi:hypothetical protein